MIRINQLKIKYDHNETEFMNKLCSLLNIKSDEIKDFEVVRQSIDARKKPEIYYSYVVDVYLKNEAGYLKGTGKKKQGSVFVKTEKEIYSFPFKGDLKNKAVVVIGSGPAGLFCGYNLIKNGFRVLILERGKDVDRRTADVDRFWEEGKLDTSSNVQFGEGGAGTFSDGKLNTLVKDKNGRNREVLDTFVRFGAKPSIVYESKPHIGTDVLKDVVKNIRNEIIRLGGEVRFESQVTDFIIEGNRLKGVVVNNTEKIDSENVVLAVGHSARDTFYTLLQKNIHMEAKAFAVGFRVMHPQSMIDHEMYGDESSDILGAAPYKVTAKTSFNRGVYSFCMCPGGYVVNASSEENRTAVNGMSYSDRGSKCANSAIIVSVDPKDYGSEGPLSGIEFQRRLEEKAFLCGNGNIPLERYSDFKNDITGMEEAYDLNLAEDCDMIEPVCKGKYTFSKVSDILPRECNLAFIEAMEVFGRQIKGFDRGDTILAGVESRTSSPVRIIRDEDFESNIKGLYPCGEGAGYAGGITSAAMDGIRVAEAVAEKLSK
ncbi:MAG: NAD(P)/FAD-dependent oxidoreductase [Acetatifactor sp.]|nr:NAD(P)/FAD-dependent oxidoreductase [Acetatifactor sp.]